MYCCHEDKSACAVAHLLDRHKELIAAGAFGEADVLLECARLLLAKMPGKPDRGRDALMLRWHMHHGEDRLARANVTTGHERAQWCSAACGSFALSLGIAADLYDKGDLHYAEALIALAEATLLCNRADEAEQLLAQAQPVLESKPLLSGWGCCTEQIEIDNSYAEQQERADRVKRLLSTSS